MINKKVLFVVAYEGYQPVEYATPKKLLEQAGFEIVTASDAAGTAMAKDGSTTTVDITLDQVNIDDYMGIFFVGGPGALDHLDNQTSYAIIQKTAGAGMPLGAICVSTRILAKAGVLTGKHATGWDGDNELADIYKEHDVNYVREPVVVDGNIVTATEPSAAEEYGNQIIALLQNSKGWG